MFVRFLVILGFLETGMIASIVENPIATDLTTDSISLISEGVNIVTDKSHAVVSGAYTFRQVKGDWPIHDYPISVDVPIILRGPQSFGSLKASTFASVAIGGRTFHPSKASIESLYDLPSGWKLYFVDFEIPRRNVPPVFTLTVR